MKKILYGSVICAVAAAIVVFFFRPPEVSPPASTVLLINFRLPQGYEFTEGAPFALTWQTEMPEEELSAPVVDKDFDPRVSPYRLLIMPKPGFKAVILKTRLYFCNKVSRMCFQDDFRIRLTVQTVQSVVPWTWDILPKELQESHAK